MNTRMPAEWEHHEATWLTWPKNKITWPGKLLARTEDIYLQMITALLTGEKVHLLVDDYKIADKILARLPRKAQTQRLVFFKAKTVDTWIRDYGPIFVHTPKGRAFTKWTFNAWGGKYSDLARDNGVVDNVSYFKSFKRINGPIVLEGGSIDVNGRGTLLTTEQCLLNKNRNPKLSRKQIETVLKKHLGLTKVIWLKEGIEGDDTDGHVDDITRFVAPRKIITATESNPNDKNHHYLSENLALLKEARDQDGKKFEIVELPMPGYVRPASVSGKKEAGHGGVDRLPASYANFYIGNRVVLLPLYNHDNDKKALKIVSRCFPGRKVVGIQCSALVYGMGSIHCVSQQQPI